MKIIEPELLKKINSEMHDKKLFLNPNLTLKAFSDELKEPTRKISHHINHGLGRSFIDFVNEFRVDECKKKIEKGDLTHLTLTGIALESGFNSKSTFNRVFKKMSGQSPSSFQKASQNKN